MSETLSRSVLSQYQEIVQQFPNYEPRPSQERMVLEIAKSLENKQTLVVEAGTGSGKSFGYLIPALLQEKRPVVVSTATIALQEQLLNKDIPFLAAAAGMEDLNVKLVKGRGNYLCIHKLKELERHIKQSSREILYLDYLKGELSQGWDGDQATLEMAIPPEIWSEVRSDAEDCLGRKCPFFNQNPYRIAREDLDTADILVSNHALYLQDLVAGNSLLPSHEIVIFDEAHHLKQAALNAFTARIGKYATTKVLQKIYRRLQPVPEEFSQAIADSEAIILEWLFRSQYEVFRLYPDAEFLMAVERHTQILKEMESWLGGVNVKQLSIVETDLDADRAIVQKDKLVNQLAGLALRWEYFQLEAATGEPRVNWVEVQKDRLYYELRSTPLNIAGIFRSKLWPEKTAILTSATLSVNKSMTYFIEELGIDEEVTEAPDVILPSHFAYEKQCLLYLPEGMPDPNSPQFNLAAADEIERIVNLTQGRAFILFTSWQNMQTVSQALIPRLPYPCKVQGDMPRRKLIDWFKETPNSVIFATSTFWEGIDIPGEDLTAVIIDKIPFSPPGDPVNQAQVDYLKLQGKDWFSGYVLPQAVIRLKQGFGRLIRTSEDRGIVAILDPRLKTKGYGRVIQRSLPNVAIAHQFGEIRAEFLNLPLEMGLVLDDWEDPTPETSIA